ncbi:hypothetical protein [Prauserella shujinwangii]|uniref:hypothetical protein n=1 Tax=Prauserella shujinwangii TaxID=1453103 RepID=UPI001FE27037|nr:hypothetical protein [Prauserella shujinwangii]
MTRSFARALRAAAALGLVPVALLLGAGAAHAEQSVQAEPNAMTFGLLGPVGLAAVVLGVVGMAAGVVRQRRKTREEAAAAERVHADVPALAGAVAADEPAPRASA